MRRTMLLGCFLVASCGSAARTDKKTTAREAHTVDTGDPVPLGVAEPASCRPADGGFRFLGAEPHVPLAITAEGEVREVDGACCAAWGHEGDTWTALDAWGAPAAQVTIAGGEGYDVTQCYELYVDGEDSPTATDVPMFGTGAAAARAPLLVRGDTAWAAPPSARWEPTAEQRASLLAFAAATEVVFAPALGDDLEVAAAPPLEERIVYFQLPGDDGDDRVITRYAAIGGRALVIAGLDAAGTWRTQHVDAEWGIAAGPWLDDAYRVLAVFDVDGDGFAEVVVHRSDGPSWDDVILRCSKDSTLRPWAIAAESIGGSTA